MVGMTLLLMAAAAQSAGEVEYQRGALGYDALVAANYATAENQLRDNHESGFDDPARLINLGQVYANTGRAHEAERLFKRAMDAEDVAVILADGRELSSRTAARMALDSLRVSEASGR